MLVHRSNKKFVYGFLFLVLLFVIVMVIYKKSSPGIVLKTSVIYTEPSQEDHYLLYDKKNIITLVNYFSLDCDHCKKAYLLEDGLISTLATSSKNINIIYRHNPLLSQPLSKEKALISECVYNQTGDAQFFNFIKEVFVLYKKSNNNLWVKDIAKKYLTSQEKFDQCLISIAMKEKIQKQKNDNVLSGITYTPTILVYQNKEFVRKYDGISGAVAHEILKYYLQQNK